MATTSSPSPPPRPSSKTPDSALFPLADGRFLAVVAKAGFFHLDPATGAVTPWATPAAALLRDTAISAGVRLRDGSFVLGTRAVGLVVVSADGARVRRLDRNTGLVDNVVLSLAPDPAGGLWVGYNTGTARVELDSPVSVFDGNNGPPSGTIDSWGRHEGVLYAGAYDGLWRLEPGDPATGVGARFTKDPRPVSNVFAIEPHAGDTLIAANIGLGRLVPDGVETLVPCGANSPLCMIVSRVVPGRVYIGGALGVTVARKTPAGWKKLAEFHELGDVHTAAEEADGTLWLATYARGFWRLPQAGAITDWKSAQPRQFLENCGLPDVVAWTAVFDAPGGASLFTDKGSFRLDGTATRCIPEDRFNLPGETRPAIYPFVRAAIGDGWATVYTATTLETDYPLGRFLPSARGAAWQPAPAAALAEIGFAGAAVMALDRTPVGSEVVWARGYHNTVRLALDHTPPPPAPWHAIIRSFNAAGAAQPLPAASAATTPLQLPFSREPIAFTLAAPASGAGGDVRFSTRLVGYSDRWSAPSSTAEVSFTNLEGGPFTLEVRAFNAEGRTSTPATLTFSVAPPWHRTTAAYALYILAVSATIFAYIRWRLSRGERERARLEALVATRTADLAVARDAAEAASRAKSAFLASMSHELRTPLNGVLGYAQLLQHDKRLAPDQQERLRIVHTSGEHLLHMINDVLDLAKIEAGKLTLRPAPFALGDLLHDIAAAHLHAAGGKASPSTSTSLATSPGGSKPTPRNSAKSSITWSATPSSSPPPAPSPSASPSPLRTLNFQPSTLNRSRSRSLTPAPASPPKTKPASSKPSSKPTTPTPPPPAPASASRSVAPSSNASVARSRSTAPPAAAARLPSRSPCPSSPPASPPPPPAAASSAIPAGPCARSSSTTTPSTAACSPISSHRSALTAPTTNHRPSPSTASPPAPSRGPMSPCSTFACRTSTASNSRAASAPCPAAPSSRSSSPPPP